MIAKQIFVPCVHKALRWGRWTSNLLIREEIKAWSLRRRLQKMPLRDAPLAEGNCQVASCTEEVFLPRR